MDKVEVAIIGAGVVGLAIAAELSKKYQDIVLVEKENSFGQHTSSRNSEVIHAGIYYPANSLKARHCVEGNKLLYRYCSEHNVPFSKVGKLIIAADKSEIGQLQELKKNAEANGVFDLEWCEQARIRELEPAIKAEAALFSPSTGIIDSHQLMKRLEGEATGRGAMLSYGSELTSLKRVVDGYELELNNSYRFRTDMVINSAGLFADKIAAMAGIDIDQAGYKLHYCKGEYFSYKKTSFLKRLVYPVPEADIKGLGIHAVLDLGGGLKFGPSAEYVETIDYKVDPAHRAIFFNSIRETYSQVREDDLFPDQAGIRPKLQGPKDGFRDFVIQEESGKGLPGMVNLIGIESPGLTASLGIAKIMLSLFMG